VSAHGRRGPGPEPAGPAQWGPAQFGWALVVVAAAVIGGLAAATLVHASLVIAVVVSLVIGAIGVVVTFRSPARSPELTAPHPATMPRARPSQAVPPPESYPPDPVAPATPVVAAGVRGPGGRALVGFGSGSAGAERGGQAGARPGPVHLPGLQLHRAVPALRRVPARHQAGQERLGFPLRGVRAHLDLAAGHAVAAGPGHASLIPLESLVIAGKQRRSIHV